MPRVSVVIPTYNRAEFLPTTLDSALSQTYRDFEIVVVDDGSTDNTLEIFHSYTGRIRSFHQQNTGEGGARNRGIQESTGEFIAFLDSDDLWIPEKLDVQMTVLGQTPGVMWGYSDAYAFDGVSGRELFRFSRRTRQYSGEVTHRLLFTDFIPSPTAIVRRSVFEETGGFSDLKVGADWEMWLRIAARYPVARCPAVLAGYRIHKGAVSSQIDVSALLSSRLEVIRRAASAYPGVYASLATAASSRQYVSAARAFLRLGDMRRARAMWWRAILLNPGSLNAYTTVGPMLLGGSLAKRLISEYDCIRDQTAR